MKNNNMKKIFKLIVISLCTFLADRVSKILIINNFQYLKENTIIKNFFSIIYVKNTGAAWSLFEEKQSLLIIISLIFLVFLIFFILKEKLNKLENVSCSLIIGGILGNLYDRIIFSHVIDFLSFNIFGYDFPIFNLADTFIVVGVMLLIVGLLRSEKNDRSRREKY